MTEPIGERPAMAAYGTDSPDWEALRWEWAAERLVPNRNYWVVTVTAGGAPHALPVWGRLERRRPAIHVFLCAQRAQSAQHSLQPASRLRWRFG